MFQTQSNSTKNNKHCMVCDETGHTSFYCPRKARTPLKTVTQLKQAGKYHNRFNQAKRIWYANNPPNHEGYYFCIYCGKPITRVPELLEQGVALVTIDHRLSRGDRPDLRYEQSNLAPSCWDCNKSKGSKSIEKGKFET